ncbi:MAG TPA: prolipoprotein diacylglyceryl transferase [Dehalococcoidia bacterium]|nr:prolipoprotein diacylglyceryl transferase [Dehalococcoidia bacterium]
MLSLLAITIDIDPEIGKFGPFLITWHGFFTTVGIAVAVILAAYLATRRGVLEDDVYNVALWAVPGGIVGARLLFVLEHAGSFRHNIGGIFALNEGGISIYGGLVGGALLGWGYAYIKRLPMRRISDAAALGMAMGQAIGRLGDFINGEHWAKPTHLPWAFCYVNPKALVYGPPYPDNSCGPLPFYTQGVHPVAGLYEPLLLLLAFGVLLYLQRVLRRDGYVFWIFVLAYSAIRFGLGALRTNEQVVHLQRLTISVPQLAAIALAIVALIAIRYISRLPEPPPSEPAPPPRVQVRARPRRT